MEEGRNPLLAPENENENLTTKWDFFVGELKMVSYIAMPMVVATVTQYLLRAASMMMLGHLGELALSSAAIATSLTNVTGFSLLSGMACALETLCGQAYGAGQFHKLGTYTYGATIWLCLACLPVSLLWIYTENILLLTGQDSHIAAEAGNFSIWLIPSLFPYAILQAFIRFLQTQSLILPMLFSTLATLCIHLPLSWALIFKTDLGSVGAALAIGFSYWLNVIFLGLYVKYSAKCAKTRTSFSMDVFGTVREFFRFAIPSAVMVCLEWWTFEIVILLGGLLPNPQQETSVLSICLTIETIHFLVPYSVGAAARSILHSHMISIFVSFSIFSFASTGTNCFCSTRISNELGAGRPKAAQLVLSAVMSLAVVEFAISGTLLFACRYVLGYAFSNEEIVVLYVKDMTPLLCISIVTDSLQSVLSGVARGCGWQHIGAYINLGAYYLVGIPVALLLGFVMHLKGEGLWWGLIAGAATQSILLGIITFHTDWDKKAKEARRRIFHENIPTHVS